MALLNVGAGLSAMGGAIAQQAGSEALLQQKADLERAQTVLAGQVQEQVQHAGIVESGAQQMALEKQRESGQTGITQLQTASAEKIAGSQQASAQSIARLEAQSQQEVAKIETTATPPEVRTAKWYATASPEERAAFNAEQMARAGLPPGLMGPDLPPSSAPAGTGNDQPPSDNGADINSGKGESGKSGEAAPPSGNPNLNEHALDGVPPATAGVIKAMVEGRIIPPTSFAMAKPYWQTMIRAASQYDPSFDQTTWAARVATRRDFTAGQAAKAITSLNQTLGHAGVLMDDFNREGNFGGVLTPLNSPANWLSTQFGSDKVTNTREAVDAVASEARKVFAASGGGNLTELNNWQQNFPINGSPEQQKGALTQLVSLLDSRMDALADQYNRGMGRTEDPINFLEPHAQQVYSQLTGRMPAGAEGFPTGGQRNDTAVKVGAAPVNPKDRQDGMQYLLPNGKTGTWMGTGWGNVH